MHPATTSSGAAELAAAPQPFLVVARRSCGRWGAAALLVGGLAFGFGSVFAPAPLVLALGWLLAGLVLVPALFVAALGAVVALLSVCLGLLALPSGLRRRPTGLRELLVAVWALPLGIVPGYWRALRRVERPWLWGSLLGLVLGTAACLAVRGLTAG